jgi:hypothetical protein
MQAYEIRVLRADGRASLIFESLQVSDRAAIDAAIEFARGAPYEVWRDLACLRGNSAPIHITLRRSA